MRLYIVSVCLFICTFRTAVNGQPNGFTKFGVKAGVNKSQFIEKQTDNSFYTAFSIGLMTEQQLTRRFGLSYELLYSKQGNLVYIKNPGLFNRVRTRYDYIALPVALRFSLKKYPVELAPGIQYSYLLKNQTEFLPKNGYTNNNIPYLKKNDLGFFLGLRYRPTTRILGEIRYYQSYLTVFKGFKGTNPQTGMYVQIPAVQRLNQVWSASLTVYPFVK